MSGLSIGGAYDTAHANRGSFATISLVMNSTLRQTSIIFYLALAVLIGAFHLAYSIPIELDFDTLEKWYVADKLAKDWNFQWLAIDHHTMRWAIVVPQAIVSALVPGNYISFYIVPIIGYSIFLLVLIFLSEKSSGIPRRYLVLVTVSPSHRLWRHFHNRNKIPV